MEIEHEVHTLSAVVSRSTLTSLRESMPKSWREGIKKAGGRIQYWEPMAGTQFSTPCCEMTFPVESCTCIAFSEWTCTGGIDVRPLLIHVSCHLKFGYKTITGIGVHALEPAGAAVKAGADCVCRGPHGNGHNFLNSQRICTILFLLKRYFCAESKHIRFTSFLARFCYF